MRLQHCNATSFQVVYPHFISRGAALASNETWASKGHDCSYDWEGRAWNSTMIKPGDWVRVVRPGDSGLSRGKGCRPEGMVIACVGSDYLILWAGDASVDRFGV